MATQTNTGTNIAGLCPAPQRPTKKQVGEAQTLAEIFGDPIHVYTRAQAIEDGFLVDVTDTAKEAGFRVPVALSRAAWADCVEWTERDSQRQTYQDQDGRLWDVLWMAMNAARRNTQREAFEFQLYRVLRGGRSLRPKLTRLVCSIGPGDNGEPVITIMLPGED